MSKNLGPYFEFELEHNGSDISFVLYPGNVSEHLFHELLDLLTNIFRNTFGENNTYIKKVTRAKEINGENKDIETLAISQQKVPNVVNLIMGRSPSSHFKIHLIGENKDGEREDILITNSTEALDSRRLIPMYNKNNNNITTTRRK